MARATWIGVGAAAIAACGGFLLGGPLDLVDAHGDGDQPPALVQDAGCAASEATSVAPDVGGSGLRQDVTAIVPAMAMIRVDANGSVRSAWTNTGCAPQASDDFFVIHPDDSIEPVPGDDFAERAWIGDFATPGVYVDQTG